MESDANQVFAISCASLSSMRIQCRPAANAWSESPTDRQERFKWFDTKRYDARVAVLGLGVGSRVAEMLVRKGYEGIDLSDYDSVEPSNLHRQYYFEGDIGKKKAIALANNLKRIAVRNTLIRAFPVRAEHYLSQNHDFDAAVCVVDDDEAREFIGRAMLRMEKPCVFGAASLDGNSCRVFVQEPGKACYAGCSGGFGGAASCGPLPAISDIQGVLASIIVYVIDTLLMERPRHWNFRHLSLSGGDLHRMIDRVTDCEVCGRS